MKTEVLAQELVQRLKEKETELEKIRGGLRSLLDDVEENYDNTARALDHLRECIDTLSELR